MADIAQILEARSIAASRASGRFRDQIESLSGNEAGQVSGYPWPAKGTIPILKLHLKRPRSMGSCTRPVAALACHKHEYRYIITLTLFINPVLQWLHENRTLTGRRRIEFSIFEELQ